MKDYTCAPCPKNTPKYLSETNKCVVSECPSDTKWTMDILGKYTCQTIIFASDHNVDHVRYAKDLLSRAGASEISQILSDVDLADLAVAYDKKIVSQACR